MSYSERKKSLLFWLFFSIKNSEILRLIVLQNPLIFKSELHLFVLLKEINNLYLLTVSISSKGNTSGCCCLDSLLYCWDPSAPHITMLLFFFFCNNSKWHNGKSNYRHESYFMLLFLVQTPSPVCTSVVISFGLFSPSSGS